MRPPTIPPAPADAEGLRLHQALSLPVATAPYDFARFYLPHLTAWLQTTNPRACADLCEEAAVETIYSLLHAPARFDPSKGKALLSFLRMSARCDLRNLLRRETRHQHEPLDENSVAFASSAGKYSGKVKGPLQLLCELEDEQERQQLLEKVRAISNQTEQAVLDLMVAGIRNTDVYAEVLAIAHLLPRERRKQVKRVKDRINKRIERLRDKP